MLAKKVKDLCVFTPSLPCLQSVHLSDFNPQFRETTPPHTESKWGGGLHPSDPSGSSSIQTSSANTPFLPPSPGPQHSCTESLEKICAWAGIGWHTPQAVLFTYTLSFAHAFLSILLSKLLLSVPCCLLSPKQLNPGSILFGLNSCSDPLASF